MSPLAIVVVGHGKGRPTTHGTRNIEKCLSWLCSIFAFLRRIWFRSQYTIVVSDMCLDQALKIVQIVAYSAGAFSALFAVSIANSNARRERAEWLEKLYARFYENTAHTNLREILDKNEKGSPIVSELLSQERSEWTNYLNVFEFVAYLQKSNQLTKDDVDALFRYPLACLRKHPEVLAYIRDEANDYQKLTEKLSEYD